MPAPIETPAPRRRAYTRGLACTLVASATMGLRALPGGTTSTPVLVGVLLNVMAAALLLRP
jgi:hypothetical protein